MNKTLNDLHIGAMFADKETPNLLLRVGGRDLPGYPGTIGVADSIIKQGCFDARELENPDRNRSNWGNNHYPTSNAHQWLNAEGNDWYKPQHDHDAPPIADNIFDEYNPYANDPGFLSRFSRAFRDALTEADIKTRNAKTGDTETVKAKVWLLSATEVGFDKDGSEGAFLPLFDDFRMKIAAPNTEAVKTASCKPEGFNPTGGWPYFLRSPYTPRSDSVRLVRTDGSESSYRAYYGSYGLRPALLLKSGISVSDEPDERGVYIIG
jgi:hypothetical protein